MLKFKRVFLLIKIEFFESIKKAKIRISFGFPTYKKRFSDAL